MAKEQFQDKRLEDLANKGLDQAAEKFDLSEIDLQLDQMINERLTNKKQAKIKRINWWAIAAGIALLCIASFVFLSPKSDQQLYATNFEVYPNNIAQPVRGEVQQNETLTAAAKAYDVKQYDKVVSLLSSLDQETIRARRTKIYHVIALLESDKPDEAIELMEGNMENIDDDQKSAFKYYLGLAYLKTKNRKEARLIFQNINNSDSYYHAKAQTILNDIN